jgi:hypothetical protein
MHYIEDQSILTAFEEKEFVDLSLRKQEGDHAIYLTRNFDHPASYGEPVLCDFGVAVYGNKENDREAYPQVYRCPEVMLHKTWTYSADIWNVVLWYITSIKKRHCSVCLPSLTSSLDLGHLRGQAPVQRLRLRSRPLHNPRAPTRTNLRPRSSTP